MAVCSAFQSVSLNEMNLYFCFLLLNILRFTGANCFQFLTPFASRNIANRKALSQNQIGTSKLVSCQAKLINKAHLEDLKETTKMKAISKMSTLAYNYSRYLDTHPLTTKALTATALAAVGDILCQAYEISDENSKKMAFDFKRTVVFASVAAVYGTPVQHYWFNFLHGLKLPELLAKNQYVKAVALMLVDQTVGAPIATAGFYVVFEMVSVWVGYVVGVGGLFAEHE